MYLDLRDISDGSLLSSTAIDDEQLRVVHASPNLKWAVCVSRDPRYKTKRNKQVVDVNAAKLRSLKGYEGWIVIDAVFDIPNDTAIIALKDQEKFEIARFKLPELNRESSKVLNFEIRKMELAAESQEIVAVSDDQRLYRLNAKSMDTISRSDDLGYSPYTLSISSDERLVAIAGRTGMVDELDRSDFSRVARHFGNRFQVRNLQYSKGGRLWTCGNDHSLVSFSGGADSEKVILDVGGSIRSIKFSHDSSMIAVTRLDSPSTTIWSVEDESIQHTFSKSEEGEYGHASGAMFVAFDPTDTKLYTLGWDRIVCVWDIESGRLLNRIESDHTAGVQSGAVTSDGKFLFSVSDDGSVGVWDLGEQRFSRRLKGSSRLFACDVSPKGDLLIAGGLNFDTSPVVCDLSSGVKNASVDETQIVAPKGCYNCRSLEFSPDGKFLAMGKSFNTIYLVHTRTWKVAWKQHSHLEIVGDIAFSPDGTRIVSVSDGGRVILWDTETGQEIMRLNGHQGIVTSVDFSPDGKTIATGGRDGKVFLWKTE